MLKHRNLHDDEFKKNAVKLSYVSEAIDKVCY